jgi:hypothetical protein
VLTLTLTTSSTLVSPLINNAAVAAASPSAIEGAPDDNQSSITVWVKGRSNRVYLPVVLREGGIAAMSHRDLTGFLKPVRSVRKPL